MIIPGGAVSRLKPLTITVAGVLAATVAGCSSGPAPGASQTTGAAADGVTIVAIEMLTGDGAFYGQAVRDGLLVAADTLNAAGGIMGKKINLKVVDNASDNAQTATLVKQFAADPTVGAIIPPTYQPNFNAACSAADAAGLPIISAQSGPPDPAGDKNGNCFTMTTDPVPQVTFTLNALKAAGVTSFAMVYDQDNGYVKFQKPNIEAAAKAAGVTITEIGVPGGTSDFGPQITQLIDADPQTTFPFFTIEDASRFMKQAKGKGYDKAWFDPVSQLTSKRIPELSSSAAVGLTASTPQSAGDIPSFQTFLDAYKTKFGKDLDDPTYTGFGYDALSLMAAAMTTAKSTTDRPAIKAAIDATDKTCFSICYTQSTEGSTKGAFLADKFFLVKLDATGFVPAS
jgi:branched-chain amino acid transport system substrate-binding protein